MTDRPADARAFSRPTSKATEKRPGSKLGKSGPIRQWWRETEHAPKHALFPLFSQVT